LRICRRLSLEMQNQPCCHKVRSNFDTVWAIGPQDRTSSWGELETLNRFMVTRIIVHNTQATLLQSAAIVQSRQHCASVGFLVHALLVFISSRQMLYVLLSIRR
jgi:hypothetical protein